MMGKNSDSWSKESYRERDNDKQRGHHHRHHRHHHRSYSNSRRSSEQQHHLNRNDFDDDDTTTQQHSNYDENDEQQGYVNNNRKYRQQNDDDDGSDHHHNHRSYSKNHRDRNRDRRSRSRSYERNDSHHHHNQNNRYQQDSDEHYYDERSSYPQQNQQQQQYHHQRERREEKPNNTLMIRNLPLHINDKNIMEEINQFGLYPKDVRLMKNKETGHSRGFAFIEFVSIEQATQLKELTQDCLTFGGEYECTLHYSFPKDNLPIDKSILKSDWSCPKCGINNFKRRDECFKCGTSKDETPIDEDNNNNNSNSITVRQPTNVLLIGNLSSKTTEETVLATIGSQTSLPIKSIRMIMANRNLSLPPTNTCCVELHSVYEATELFKIITSLDDGGLTIDNHLATISYGKRIDQQQSSSLIANNTSMALQNAAVAALAAAQWKNLDDSSNTASSASSATKKPNLGSVTLNGVKYTKYPQPDYNSFHYDATSGFYYDSTTGFHYDSNSQYFYNSQNQKYMYYDTTNQVYITVDSNGQATNESSSIVTSAETVVNDKSKSNQSNQQQQQKTLSSTEEKTTDKAKIAKKIAKDMEKWAKTLANSSQQRKELSTKPQVFQTDAEEEPECSSASNISYRIFEKQQQQISNSLSATADDSIKLMKETIDPFEIIKAEEEKLIDRDRLACMLCKRQFNSGELLAKHQQLSGLHKTNLSVLRQTLLNDEQLEHVEQVEREMNYRDRAKERRDKYGIDDTPEFSKRKFEMEKQSLPPLKEKTPPPISDDNIGNRMLKAMGWTEGTGLGKSNQGMSGIIEVERRKSGLGLGNQNATFSRESYKEAVRRTALQRFKEMNDN
ncbi:RNA-binding protein 5, variant 2 [Dermatophagoides farinae]|uniref:RNA-binding protein 5, variant 2 n=2 Tax=Dermatophagoides farinae TaxID=6954 RepID=A0A922L8X6_DERFA|nr:RNA-binding protein 10-like [Dermatophagoides farinae]KAH9526929.1 RNA-binding protein 5, variant 2 [Dermatophagoides farinae]